jgi:UDP-glucose 4-epimerase
MLPERYLISGASGYIGHTLFHHLKSRNISCVGIGRKNINEDGYVVCDLFDSNTLSQLLSDVTCVVHCAGYAHAFKARSSEVKDATWRINYQGTKNLIEIAANKGVSKFINLSSVKAMGKPGLNCVDESWPAPPTSEYGKSKRAAEDIVIKICTSNHMSYFNLRLAMVYGRESSGNFYRMMHLVSRGLFPPIPETLNHRSLVHIDDVIGAIMCLAKDMRAYQDTFIVAGPESPSGRYIYNQMRNALGFPNNTFEIPVVFLDWMAIIFEGIQSLSGIKMPFNKEVLDRLLGSAWYSTKKIETIMNWSPRISLEDGLKKMVNEK